MPLRSRFVAPLHILGLILSAPSTFASLKAPPVAVQATVIGKDLELRVTPPTRHHLNVRAPLTLEIDGQSARREPHAKSEKLVRFRLPLAAAKLKLTTFLCDDANTFCERHVSELSWDGQKLSGAEAIAGDRPAKSGKIATPAPDDGAGRGFEKKTHLGFLVNQPNLALDRARREKKPLLIDFFGIWCPPCNQLDEKVFNTAEFKKAAKDFVLLKLDADSEVSWALKVRFHVGGYPTLIFANSDGEEIDRVSGFRPTAEIVKELMKAWELRNETMESLQKQVKNGDPKAIIRLGRIHLARNEYEQAFRILKSVPGGEGPRDEAELSALAGRPPSAERDAELRGAFERIVRDRPETPESVGYRLRLAKLISGQDPQNPKEVTLTRSLREQAIALAQKLIAQPQKLAGQELTPADLWQSVAETEELLQHPDFAKAAWKKAVAEYRSRIRSPSERGYNLELAYCLWNSGDVAGAEKIYRALEKAYPDEFTFYFNHARMSLELKRYAEAHTLAFRALDRSYGDNRLRVAHLVARVQIAEGLKRDALSTLRTAIQEAKVPADHSVRTHAYVDKLKELEYLASH